MIDAPPISVILCTRNRATSLARALDTLNTLRYPGDWELVIVDNASSDATPGVIEAFEARAPCPVRHVQAPVPGLSRARNIGLAHASKPLVAFVDDDCYPAVDYLEATARAFTDPTIGFAGGRVLLHDPNEQRITVQESTQGERIAPLTFLRSGRIHGANMAFRRDAVIALRGFDERLGAGTLFRAAEDSDMMRRLSAAGWHGLYAPDMVVRHHHGRTTRAEVAALLAGYDRGIGAGMIKCLLDARLRATYARGWYWKMREVGTRRALRQLGWGLCFALRYGPTRRHLMRHPAPDFSVTDASQFTERNAATRVK